MKTINHARATEKGLIFYSSMQHLACYTYFDENDEIRSEIFLTFLENDDESVFLRKFKFKYWQRLLFDISLICIGIFILKSPSFTSGAIFFSLTASRYFFAFIQNWLNIRYNKPVGKFHAAEHMAVNSYTELKRIPSIEEIKKFSRFTKGCGSFELISKTVLYTLTAIILSFSVKNILLYFLLSFTLGFIIFCNKTNEWLKYFQVFFTLKPTDKELNLAIEALKNFEEMEECIEFSQAAFDSLFGVEIGNMHLEITFNNCKKCHEEEL